MVVVSHLFFFFQINFREGRLVVSHTLPVLELSISRRPLCFQKKELRMREKQKIYIAASKL